MHGLGPEVDANVTVKEGNKPQLTFDLRGAPPVADELTVKIVSPIFTVRIRWAWWVEYFLMCT